MKPIPFLENIDFFNLFHQLNISNDTLFDLAFESRLIKRRRVIDPADLLHALCVESSQGTVSHNDLAAKIESGSGVSVSKVSVWKKINEHCLVFLKKVFELVIRNKFLKNPPKPETLLFNRIIVQDSTIIRLPQRLFDEFSGVANGYSKVCNSRIQGVYDLVSEQFLRFSVDCYSKNDSEAAPELVIAGGDLTLRDRGYLIADEIQRHINMGADCIYRHKFSLSILDTENEKPIDLLALLKKKKSVDMEIKLNNNSKTKVRLIAFPTSEEIAGNRRRKAKKENRKSPTAEYLELLGWSIYLTTIAKETADAEKIFVLYKLRWRIEIIFKSWKSNMAFDKVHNVSKIQLWVIIWSRFIMITICSQVIYSICRHTIKAKLNKDLSLMKVTHYLIRNPHKLTMILMELNNKPKEPCPTMNILAKYCSYDKRKRT
ncbi:IS4 family transposase, partial [Aquiflexum sp. TKW24L]|uniref:IS4 family transposase n=1 Tax=Aquiflexum sp. TKW24L TaxID=2942212 RepID=UPI0020C1693A